MLQSCAEPGSADPWDSDAGAQIAPVVVSSPAWAFKYQRSILQFPLGMLITTIFVTKKLRTTYMSKGKESVNDGT